MTLKEFFEALHEANGVAEVETAIEVFEMELGKEIHWIPVGNRKRIINRPW